MGKIKTAHYRIDLGSYGQTPDHPFSIAVLSDLHNNIYHATPEELLALIRRQHIAAVFSVGDMVVMKAGRFATQQAVYVLSELAKEYPVITIKGNHEMRMERVYSEEYDAYMGACEAAGVIDLTNERQMMEINGARIAVTGLMLERTFFLGRYERTLTGEMIDAIVGRPEEGAYNILLAHHPKYFQAYAQWGADLTLSGHLHGGIVRLPLLGGAVGPDPSIFPKYCHGLYEIGRSKLVVSAGLGTHSINVRINNPAELVILDFE